ncbi:hypothetical protein AcW1_004231 [Taiwanofungus camphoratus]|nr:hypothetical protein AcW1_004231 [Antrodia cinnamomea]
MAYFPTGLTAKSLSWRTKKKNGQLTTLFLITGPVQRPFLKGCGSQGIIYIYIPSCPHDVSPSQGSSHIDLLSHVQISMHIAYRVRQAQRNSSERPEIVDTSQPLLMYKRMCDVLNATYQRNSRHSRPEHRRISTSFSRPVRRTVEQNPILSHLMHGLVVGHDRQASLPSGRNALNDRTQNVQPHTLHMHA